MAAKTDLAWAAGFFDGEGWIGCNTYKRTSRALQIRAQISQKDRRVLDRFAAALGVGKVYGPYTHGRGAAELRYSYSANGRPAVTHIIAELWPYLGDVKREQAMLALARYDESRPAGTTPEGEHTHCPNGHPYTADDKALPSGLRCRECKRARARRGYYAARERRANA